MDLDTAKRLVDLEINKTYRSEGDCLVILDELTIAKPYGWIFFFNSKRYIETHNFIYALGGNGPVVFESATSKITMLGTALSPEEEIQRFEKEMDSSR